MHCPDSHASLCVQAFPSLHSVPSGFAGLLHIPVVGSQVPASWHWSLAVQVTGLVPTHCPDSHLSLCVQAFPSLQVVPSGFGGLLHVPVVGSHVPASWHWSRAMQVTGLVPMHCPDPHLSVCVQAFPSLQVVPSGFAGLLHAPVVGSQVPAS